MLQKRKRLNSIKANLKSLGVIVAIWVVIAIVLFVGFIAAKLVKGS